MSNNHKTHYNWFIEEQKIVEGPKLGNQFVEDTGLISILDYLLNEQNCPLEIQKNAYKELEILGNNIHQYNQWAREAETNPPKLQKYTAYGEKVNKIHTSQAWKNLKKSSVDEGLICDAYTQKYGQWSRLVQFSKLYLYSASSAYYSCPLAMTDGAAFLLRKLLEQKTKSKNANPKIEEHLPTIQHCYNNLTANNHTKFWTSGQWMTEKEGGSDVTNSTRTLAIPFTKKNKQYYKLNGLKWFTSATESEISITLAKVIDPATQKIDQKLSAFLIKLNSKKSPEKLKPTIDIIQLKDKLGTKALPTAEILLKNHKAILISERGKGVSFISDLLNVTRLYNGAMAVSSMRRLVALNRDFATKRQVFGKKLQDHALYRTTLGK